MRQLNRRQRALLLLLLTLAVLLAVTLAGALLTQRAMETDFSRMNRSPSLTFLFGTDWMGRDMLARTLAGLSLSIRIGVLTALVSAVIALLCGVAAALSRRADAVLSWCIDLFLGIPHILLVMLISLAFGRGFLGVVAGVSLSHWPSLARVIRSEVLSLRHAPYPPTCCPSSSPGSSSSFPTPSSTRPASPSWASACHRNSPPSGSSSQRACSTSPLAGGGWPCSPGWLWWEWSSSLPLWGSRCGGCWTRPACISKVEDFIFGGVSPLRRRVTFWTRKSLKNRQGIVGRGKPLPYGTTETV